MQKLFVKIWLHCLLDFGHFIGLIKHEFVEVFEIFSVNIAKAKFVSRNKSYFAIRKKRRCPLWRCDTSPICDKIRIIGIYDFQIFYMSFVYSDESERSEKSTIRSFFVSVLQDDKIIE